MSPQSYNGKFKYSKALIKEIKDLFPDDIYIHKMADEGSYELERDSVTYNHNPFSPEVLMASTSLDSLHDISRLSIRKKDIHKRCRDERNVFTISQNKKDG